MGLSTRIHQRQIYTHYTLRVWILFFSGKLTKWKKHTHEKKKLIVDHENPDARDARVKT